MPVVVVVVVVLLCGCMRLVVVPRTTHDVRFKTVSAGAPSCQTPPNLEKMGEPEIGWDDTGECCWDYDVLSCYLWDKCDRRQQGCKG